MACRVASSVQGHLRSGPGQVAGFRRAEERWRRHPGHAEHRVQPRPLRLRPREEYAAVKRQLEAIGSVQGEPAVHRVRDLQKERVKDAYPIYQFGWFPDFPDADNYLTPFFGPNNFLQSHFENPGINAQLTAEATESDATKRIELLKKIQADLAQNHLPTLPLLSGKQVAVSKPGVTGVDQTLDGSFKFRFTVLGK